MKSENQIFEYFFPNDLQWVGSREDFLEFVIMLTRAGIVAEGGPDETVDEETFNGRCDELGDTLVIVFDADISPYNCFGDLRKNTIPSFRLSRMVIRELNRIKKDISIFNLLESGCALPSHETMTDEIIHWKSGEKLTDLLWPYLNLDSQFRDQLAIFLSCRLFNIYE